MGWGSPAGASVVRCKTCCRGPCQLQWTHKTGWFCFVRGFVEAEVTQETLQWYKSWVLHKADPKVGEKERVSGGWGYRQGIPGRRNNVSQVQRAWAVWMLAGSSLKTEHNGGGQQVIELGPKSVPGKAEISLPPVGNGEDFYHVRNDWRDVLGRTLGRLFGMWMGGECDRQSWGLPRESDCRKEIVHLLYIDRKKQSAWRPVHKIPFYELPFLTPIL